MNVELIDREEALGAVAEPWRRLASERGNAFVTPEWYLAALNTLHRGSRPAVAVVRDGGEVRGLLPLVGEPSGRGQRGARFPGVRYGDIYHPVAAPGDDETIAVEAAPALAAHLGARCRLDLGRVDADATWWKALARAWPSTMATVSRPEEALPYVELDGSTWDEYLAGRSRGLRNQIGRKMRGLRKSHDVRMRRSEATEDVLADFWTMFRLHDARWRGRDTASSVVDAAARDFHLKFVLDAHRRGWLRLFLLEVDAVAVAGWYGWRVGDRFSYYQAGFDPSWEPPQRGVPAARRDGARGVRRRRRRVRPAARRRGLQGAVRNRKAARSVGAAGAPPVSAPRLTATARAWIARARGRGVDRGEETPSSSRAG